MSINPETLQEDTEEERLERQRRTGSIGSGMTVICTPTEDPDVVEIQHRAVCLMRPYPSCRSCPHRVFTLTFKGTPDRYEQVLCPMWSGIQERLEGKQPAEYMLRELATCADKPFEFCASCPSKEDLAKLGIDKTKDGWYARWKRFTREVEEDE